jgi:hypothetical protein
VLGLHYYVAAASSLGAIIGLFATVVSAAPVQAGTVGPPVAVTSHGTPTITLGTSGSLAAGRTQLVMLVIGNPTSAPVGPLTIDTSVPAGTSMSPLTAAQHICSGGGTTSLSCNVGIVQPGESAEYQFGVTPRVAGSLDVQAFASATVATPRAPTSTADLVLQVNPAPTVAIPVK